MRNDIVLRPLPCHFYDVERMESWGGSLLPDAASCLSTFAATLPHPNWTQTPPYRR